MGRFAPVAAQNGIGPKIRRKGRQVHQKRHHGTGCGKLRYAGLQDDRIVFTRQKTARTKRASAPIEFISEALGHADLRTTESYLASFGDDMKRASAAKLTDFGKKGKEGA